jgi:hypothetical protein
MHNNEKTGDVTPDGESTLKIDKNGFAKRWFNKQGQFHRRDGPAVEYKSGTKGYYVNNKLHRLDGPAVEFASGTKEWWIDDKKYSYEDWKKELEHRKNLDTIYGKGEEVDLNLKGFNA